MEHHQFIRYHLRLLQSTNLLHLLRTSTPLIKLIAKPFPCQLPRQLNPNHPLPKTQHLRIITLDAPLHAERVVRGDGSDALDFVGGNGDTETGSANEEGAVGFAFCYEAGGGGGAVGVGGFVVVGEGAYVCYRFNAGVGLEVGFDFVLVAEAGFLRVGQYLLLK